MNFKQNFDGTYSVWFKGSDLQTVVNLVKAAEKIRFDLEQANINKIKSVVLDESKGSLPL